ncbi:hypothetical protein HYV82_04450 [Candidatus Woesearchaeota archaeon]|nr:hypothetical protein [Candidatus Woesearchaeota archaeon]
MYELIKMVLAKPLFPELRRAARECGFRFEGCHPAAVLGYKDCITVDRYVRRGEPELLLDVVLYSLLSLRSSSATVTSRVSGIEGKIVADIASGEKTGRRADIFAAARLGVYVNGMLVGHSHIGLEEAVAEIRMYGDAHNLITTSPHTSQTR